MGLSTDSAAVSQRASGFSTVKAADQDTRCPSVYGLIVEDYDALESSSLAAALQAELDTTKTPPLSRPFTVYLTSPQICNHFRPASVLATSWAGILSPAVAAAESDDATQQVASISFDPCISPRGGKICIVAPPAAAVGGSCPGNEREGRCCKSALERWPLAVASTGKVTAAEWCDGRGLSASTSEGSAGSTSEISADKSKWSWETISARHTKRLKASGSLPHASPTIEIVPLARASGARRGRVLQSGESPSMLSCTPRVGDSPAKSDSDMEEESAFAMLQQIRSDMQQHWLEVQQTVLSECQAFKRLATEAARDCRRSTLAFRARYLHRPTADISGASDAVGETQSTSLTGANVEYRASSSRPRKQDVAHSSEPTADGWVRMPTSANVRERVRAPSRRYAVSAEALPPLGARRKCNSPKAAVRRLQLFPSVPPDTENASLAVFRRRRYPNNISRRSISTCSKNERVERTSSLTTLPVQQMKHRRRCTSAGNREDDIACGEHGGGPHSSGDHSSSASLKADSSTGRPRTACVLVWNAHISNVVTAPLKEAEGYKSLRRNTMHSSNGWESVAIPAGNPEATSRHGQPVVTPRDHVAEHRQRGEDNLSNSQVEEKHPSADGVASDFSESVAREEQGNVQSTARGSSAGASTHGGTNDRETTVSRLLSAPTGYLHIRENELNLPHEVRLPERRSVCSSKARRRCQADSSFFTDNSHGVNATGSDTVDKNSLCVEACARRDTCRVSQMQSASGVELFLSNGAKPKSILSEQVDEERRRIEEAMRITAEQQELWKEDILVHHFIFSERRRRREEELQMAFEDDASRREAEQLQKLSNAAQQQETLQMESKDIARRSMAVYEQRRSMSKQQRHVGRMGDLQIHRFDRHCNDLQHIQQLSEESGHQRRREICVKKVQLWWKRVLRCSRATALSRSSGTLKSAEETVRTQKDEDPAHFHSAATVDRNGCSCGSPGIALGSSLEEGTQHDGHARCAGPRVVAGIARLIVTLERMRTARTCNRRAAFIELQLLARIKRLMQQRGARKIQNAWRCHLQRKNELFRDPRIILLYLETAARRIQTFYRRWKTTKDCERAMIYQRTKAAVRIQAVHRGHRVRKRLHEARERARHTTSEVLGALQEVDLADIGVESPQEDVNTATPFSTEGRHLSINIPGYSYVLGTNGFIARALFSPAPLPIATESNSSSRDCRGNIDNLRPCTRDCSDGGWADSVADWCCSTSRSTEVCYISKYPQHSRHQHVRACSTITAPAKRSATAKHEMPPALSAAAVFESLLLPREFYVSSARNSHHTPQLVTLLPSCKGVISPRLPDPLDPCGGGASTARTPQSRIYHSDRVKSEPATSKETAAELTDQEPDTEDCGQKEEAELWLNKQASHRHSGPPLDCSRATKVSPTAPQTSVTSSVSSAERVSALCCHSSRKHLSDLRRPPPLSSFSYAVATASATSEAPSAREYPLEACAAASATAHTAGVQLRSCEISSSSHAEWTGLSKSISSSKDCGTSCGATRNFVGLRPRMSAAVIQNQTPRSMNASSDHVNGFPEGRSTHTNLSVAVVPYPPTWPATKAFQAHRATLPLRHDGGPVAEPCEAAPVAGSLMRIKSFSQIQTKKFLPNGAWFGRVRARSTAAAAMATNTRNAEVAQAAGDEGWGLQVCERLRDHEHLLLRRRTSRSERMLIHFQHQHRVGAAIASVPAACMCARPTVAAGGSRHLKAQDAIARWKQQQQHQRQELPLQQTLIISR